jgi:hypothetical protein
MTFLEVLEQTRDLLRSKGRISYRALKRQFALDDEYLDDLKVELIEVDELAIDKDGKMLVWKGDEETASVTSNTPSHSPPPVTNTPPHLAERIRAEQAAMEARGVSGGERKLVTHLFSDL